MLLVGPLHIVAILVPSEEGTPRESVRNRGHDGLVAILVPSEEGTPHSSTCRFDSCIELRSSSPPRKGRHVVPCPAAFRSNPLRSSSPPRKGRHPA